jgi:Mg-chelatase subunit ChlD
MTADYAAIALVVDRSGSMHSIASDVRGSVEQFIGEQKKVNGRAYLTLSQFDDKYEVVNDFVDINSVDEKQFSKEYTPRGTTALLDAIGRTTISLQSKLDAMPQTERPKRVIVAIITDGLENASTEFNIKQIKEMVQAKEAAGWDFIFMGATLDTIDVAKGFGFSVGKSAVFSTETFDSCMKGVSEQITQARLGKGVNFTQDQRDNLTKASSCF